MNISNRSCEETQLFGVQVLSDDVETVLRYLSMGFISFMFPLSLTVTSFTIFLILKFKNLRQTTFLLAMQLLILDFGLSISYVPAALLGAANGRWTLGLPMCSIIHAVVLFTYQLRGWLMFVFVCDRFFTVFAPFKYPKYRNKFIWSLYCVVLAVTVISVVVITGSNCSGFNRQLWICTGLYNKECIDGNCELFVTLDVIIGNIFGSLVPMIMYTALFIKAKKVRDQIITASSPKDSEQKKRDRRVNITFFSIFISIIGVTLPPIAAYIVINSILIPLEVQPPEALYVITYLLQGIYPILPTSDSIAILRNPEVRKALKIIKIKLLANLQRIRPRTTNGVTKLIKVAHA